MSGEKEDKTVVKSALNVENSQSKTQLIQNRDEDNQESYEVTQALADKNSKTFHEIDTMFQHYRIEKEIGRGGMGVVYKVQDLKLERIVALKIILLSQNVKITQIQRFIQEARSLARLRHPNIIEIYDIGNEPKNYFTMEYVEGDTFSSYLKKQNVSYQKIAHIIKKIALALHFVHENNIIHRDIKPSNIMLDKNFEPKLMDFGLAKTTDNDIQLSKTGDILGTPVYMSPEQAEGNRVEKRSDIYSLGATLYEAITGRPPFQGESYLKIIHQIFMEEIITPRALNPDIPKDLEAICLKCLEKKTHKRYQNAKLLAKDLENYIENKPIEARHPTHLTHLKKLVLRHQAMAISLVIIFFILLFSSIFSYIQWQKAKKAFYDLRREKKKVEQEKSKVELAYKRLKNEIEKRKREQKKRMIMMKNAEHFSIAINKVKMGVPPKNVILYLEKNIKEISKKPIIFLKKTYFLTLVIQKTKGKQQIHFYMQMHKIFHEFLQHNPNEYLPIFSFFSMEKYFGLKKSFILYKEVIKRKPKYALSYYLIACIYAQKGKKEQACVYLEKAVERGFKAFKHFKKEKRLKSIHKTSRFQVILERK